MDQQPFNNNVQGKQVQVRAKDEDVKGVYSNVMQVTHTQEEFVLDFLNVFGQNGVLATRVIVSPGHFKRMLSALGDNLKKYEEKFGQITPAQLPEGEIGFRP